MNLFKSVFVLSLVLSSAAWAGANCDSICTHSTNPSACWNVCCDGTGEPACSTASGFKIEIPAQAAPATATDSRSPSQN